MPEHEQTIFRKKTIERISSPEQLTDYLKVTNPGIWLILAAVILLLAGVFVWSATGTLETTVSAKVVVKDHIAQVIADGSREISEGMELRVASQECLIAYTQTDEYNRVTGVAEVTLPDGTYDGEIVVDSTRPIRFLLDSK